MDGQTEAIRLSMSQHSGEIPMVTVLVMLQTVIKAMLVPRLEELR